MWLERVHLVPKPLRKNSRRIHKRYTREIREGTVSTLEDMVRWVATLGSEVGATNATFGFEISEEMMNTLAVHESFDQFYKDMFKETSSITVLGTRTRQRVTCCICMCARLTKIRVSCGHVFHRTCIQEWVQRKNACPICQRTLEVTQVKSDQESV